MAADEDKHDSIYLTAYMASASVLVVLTTNTEQVKLVRRLFQPEHRTQVTQGIRWHIRSLPTYMDVPLVKNAVEAYQRQYTLGGSCPALSQQSVTWPGSIPSTTSFT